MDKICKQICKFTLSLITQLSYDFDENGTVVVQEMQKDIYRYKKSDKIDD